jgi:hypothetical protein
VAAKPSVAAMMALMCILNWKSKVGGCSLLCLELWNGLLCWIDCCVFRKLEGKITRLLYPSLRLSIRFKFPFLIVASWLLKHVTL